MFVPYLATCLDKGSCDNAVAAAKVKDALTWMAPGVQASKIQTLQYQITSRAIYAESLAGIVKPCAPGCGSSICSATAAAEWLNIPCVA